MKAHPGPITLLIADDEPHIRLLVGAKLRAAGFNVVVASNGQEALEQARTSRPALIVTDFQMPLLSGFEMCQRLYEDPDTSEIRAIMLTARGHKLRPSELAKTNIQLLMDKPFSPRDLLMHVYDMLGMNPEAKSA
ncbi:MAG: response regulator [Planctomycetota bacterium]